MWAPVEGRYGRTRDGRKVGPMEAATGENRGCFFAPGVFQFNREGQRWHPARQMWGADGVVYMPLGSFENVDDLVAEWIEDGPVRTVARKEIVPGEYDHVIVETIKNDPYGPRVGVGIGARNQYLMLDADELDVALLLAEQADQIAKLTSERDAALDKVTALEGDNPRVAIRRLTEIMGAAKP